MIDNSSNETAVRLARANLSLAVRLSELAHQQNMSLMEGMIKDVSGCFSEFENNARNALRSGDWASMSNACVSIPFLLAKVQTRQIQQTIDSNARTQQQTNAALREALTAWQKEAASALQHSGSQPSPMAGPERS